jgi:hypothetical protein
VSAETPQDGGEADKTPASSLRVGHDERKRVSCVAIEVSDSRTGSAASIRRLADGGTWLAGWKKPKTGNSERTDRRNYMDETFQHAIA